MFDVGWSELVIVGAVALVAIGPKDMPRVMRAFGKMAGKARTFAAEMRKMLDQAAFEAESAEKLEKQSELEKQEPENLKEK